MQPKETGEVSEAFVLAHLLQLGFPVSVPFGNNQRYDLIVEFEPKKFETAQIKAGRIKKGCVNFYPCSTNGVSYKKQDYRGQVDWFLIYCPENKKIYKIAVDVVGIRGCSLRIDEPKDGSNRSNIRWAKDYELK